MYKRQVLDVGAGSGEPLTAELIKAGFDVSAIDASPKMVAAFRSQASLSLLVHLRRVSDVQGTCSTQPTCFVYVCCGVG